MKRLDIAEGTKYGMLTYIRDAKRKALPSGQKPRIARCRCDCGKCLNVLLLHLVRGRIKSCGCNRIRKDREVVSGKYFGVLRILREKPDFITSGRRFRMVEAVCICGKINTYRLNCIRKQHSCGCLTAIMSKDRNTIHGLARSRIYSTWRNMINRCYNKKTASYIYYGKKGVRVCKEWKNSFLSFYEWSNNNGYKEDLSIDRFPNKTGNYVPDNCRWATTKQQQNNKTNNIYYSYNGETKTLAEFSEKYSIPYSRIDARINKLNWSVKEAIETKLIDTKESMKKASRARWHSHKNKNK